MAAAIVCVILAALFYAQDEDPNSNIIPSMVLSNWNDSIISWALNRNFYAQKEPQRAPGVASYTVGPNYDISGLSADSFAIIDGDNNYTDPLYFEIVPRFDNDGVLTNTLYKYNGTSVPNLELTIKTIFPPSHPFYLVKYDFKNTGATREIKFMSYVTVDTSAINSYSHTWISNDRSFTTLRGNTDAANDQETLLLGIVERDATFSDETVAVADYSSSDSPLAQFAASGALNNITECTDSQTVQIGFAYTIKIEAGKNASITFYRSFRPTQSLANSAGDFAQSKTAEYFFDAGKNAYLAWLKKGKMPTKLTDKQMDLYTHSLLFLKNAQNPTIGTITASFHPSYAQKTWTRDGFFAAYVLSEAGYKDEGSAYFRWLARCELHPADGNVPRPFFYTTYSTATGKPVPFVDPQLDNMGQFLVGAYYLYTDPATRPYLAEMKQRIEEVTDFLLNCRGKYNLITADYSIWEESSTQDTGDYMPTGYFAWTQAFGYAGLVAGAELYEKYYNDSNMASVLRQSASDLRESLLTHMVKYAPDGTEPDDGDHKYYPHIYRQLLRNMDGTEEKDPIPEERPDSSSAAWFWLGLLDPATSHAAPLDAPFVATDLAKSQYEYLINNLQQKGGDEYMGIARFTKDLYFWEGKWSPARREPECLDQPVEGHEWCIEASNYSAPWGVTTMFTLWAEMRMGKTDTIPKRIEWMSATAFDGALPVGECVNHNNRGLWTSAPDVYEHGGVYILSCLVNEHMAQLPNPLSWTVTDDHATESGDDDSDTPLWIIILLIVLFVLLFVVVIVLIYLVCLVRQLKKGTQGKKDDGLDTSLLSSQ